MSGRRRVCRSRPRGEDRAVAARYGVGKPGAHDKTSGTPVTNFKKSKALYKANSGSDRDGDGIACEKA